MLDKNKHEIIFKSILKDIYRDRVLALILGFKGGTACYLFYELPRFSTDLDFNLLELESEEKVFEKIKNILTKYGELIKADRKRNTLFFLVRHEKNKQAVKVEISLRGDIDEYELKNLLGVSILVMVRKDIFAHKLVAALERQATANRDLFDINYFLHKAWDIESKIIEKRTGHSVVKQLKEIVKFIEKNISSRNILDGLGEILEENQKDRVKDTLKSDLLFNLKNRISVES